MHDKKMREGIHKRTTTSTKNKQAQRKKKQWTTKRRAKGRRWSGKRDYTPFTAHCKREQNVMNYCILYIVRKYLT